MAWHIASIPFWVSGLFFFPLAAVASLAVKNPGETLGDQGSQFLGSTIVGGALLTAAAWLSS